MELSYTLVRELTREIAMMLWEYTWLQWRKKICQPIISIAVCPCNSKVTTLAHVFSSLSTQHAHWHASSDYPH